MGIKLICNFCSGETEANKKLIIQGKLIYLVVYSTVSGTGAVSAHMQTQTRDLINRVDIVYNSYSTGQLDVPLSSVGRSQASRLGARFSLEPVTCAYSSDLQRAREVCSLCHCVSVCAPNWFCLPDFRYCAQL